MKITSSCPINPSQLAIGQIGVDCAGDFWIPTDGGGHVCFTRDKCLYYDEKCSTAHWGVKVLPPGISITITVE